MHSLWRRRRSKICRNLVLKSFHTERNTWRQTAHHVISIPHIDRQGSNDTYFAVKRSAMLVCGTRGYQSISSREFFSCADCARKELDIVARVVYDLLSAHRHLEGYQMIPPKCLLPMVAWTVSSTAHSQ